MTWGFCGPNCPKHEETLTWRKDETARVTLQYFNRVLWAGLEMYGTLSSCFLLYSLILTALISAIGKKKFYDFHNSSYYQIPVMTIAKFEKSDLSIRLANKMDNLDRTWKWFINPFFKMCNSKSPRFFWILERR